MYVYTYILIYSYTHVLIFSYAHILMSHCTELADHINNLRELYRIQVLKENEELDRGTAQSLAIKFRYIHTYYLLPYLHAYIHTYIHTYAYTYIHTYIFSMKDEKEIQQLWHQFLSPHPWHILLTSSIPSVVWFYQAFVPVVFSVCMYVCMYVCVYVCMSN